MKFARRARTEVEVNLTPLIDVVFLLLIFFMVSTTFTKETHLTIDLPEASGEPMQVVQDQIEITINQSGEYAINNVSLVNNQLETLKSGLAKVSNGKVNAPLIITADSATPHQAVVTAMDAAGQLGFVHLSITTRNVTEEE
ncbi:MAG: biopolymer transporter ExbD [Pseudomonadales bacterium]